MSRISSILLASACMAAFAAPDAGSSAGGDGKASAPSAAETAAELKKLREEVAALAKEKDAALKAAADFESIVDKAEAETEAMRDEMLGLKIQVSAHRVNFGFDPLLLDKPAARKVENEEVVATARGYDGKSVRDAGDRFMFTGVVGSWMVLASDKAKVRELEDRVREEIIARDAASKKSQAMLGRTPA